MLSFFDSSVPMYDMYRVLYIPPPTCLTELFWIELIQSLVLIPQIFDFILSLMFLPPLYPLPRVHLPPELYALPPLLRFLPQSIVHLTIIIIGFLVLFSYSSAFFPPYNSTSICFSPRYTQRARTIRIQQGKILLTQVYAPLTNPSLISDFMRTS